MVASPIPGFITRKQASEQCERAERTLQRYWSKAIELRTIDILQHLKLRTEDGQIFGGLDVTKDLIEKLKKGGKNPTWYVHAIWVEQTYGPRVEAGATKRQAEPEEGTIEPQGKPSPSGADVIELLNQQIAQLRQDKEDLRDDLKIKNEQISEASERDRETHVLMRDLHELLRDMQNRLPAPAMSNTFPTPISPGPSESTAVQEADVLTRVPAKKTSRKSKGKSRRSSRSPAKRIRKKRKLSTFEKHAPTLHKLVKMCHRS